MEEKDFKQTDLTEEASPKQTDAKPAAAKKATKPRAAKKPEAEIKLTVKKPAKTTKAKTQEGKEPSVNAATELPAEETLQTPQETQEIAKEPQQEVSAQDVATAATAEAQAATDVEEKTELQVPVCVDEEDAVAEFSQLAQDGETQKPAEKSVDEIARELSDEITAEEQAKINAAQQKADERYHDILGDRRIKKPTKFVARLIAAVIIILLLVVIVTKIPMFFNCMMPNGKTVTRLPALMGQTSYDQAKIDEEIYNYWDYDAKKWCYFNEEFEAYRPINLPNDETDTKLPYAYADDTIAQTYTQVHIRIGKKQAGYELSDIKYVTVILYEFGDLDKAKAYGESKAEEYKDIGGQHEFQDLLFFKLGMVRAQTTDFVYDAWYNGGNYIEIYAPDADLALTVRSILNYNA